MPFPRQVNAALALLEASMVDEELASTPTRRAEAGRVMAAIYHKWIEIAGAMPRGADRAYLEWIVTGALERLPVWVRDG